MVAMTSEHFGHVGGSFLEPRRVSTLRAARRRTALVRWARRATASVMGCLVMVIAGLCVMRMSDQTAPLLSSIDEAAVRMVNPRFTGRDANARPYIIVADAAIRRPADPSRLDLERPRLSVLNDGVAQFQVFANSGVYNRNKATLELHGDVHLISGSEYEFETSQARIFVESGIAEGREPVTGHGPWGAINADAFELYRDDRRVVFEGSPVIGRLDQEPKLIAPLRSNMRADGDIEAG